MDRAEHYECLSVAGSNPVRCIFKKYLRYFQISTRVITSMCYNIFVIKKNNTKK